MFFIVYFGLLWGFKKTTSFDEAARGKTSKIERAILAERVIEIGQSPSGVEKAANILALLDSLMSQNMDLFTLWQHMTPEAKPHGDTLKSAMIDRAKLVTLGQDEYGTYHFPINRTTLGQTEDFETASNGWRIQLHNLAGFVVSGAMEAQYK